MHSENKDYKSADKTEDNNLGCKVDASFLMQQCEKLGFGYMPWSWTGNSEQNQWLDMVEYCDRKTPTKWGELLFNSTFGIKIRQNPVLFLGKEAQPNKNKTTIEIANKMIRYRKSSDEFMLALLWTKEMKYCKHLISALQLKKFNSIPCIPKKAAKS